ncbi:hypothetical protein H6F78_16835 [Coleofasciculus sp. FACHB-64]|uniref:hypothetical protein n=1 Tax=Cyanophyceae TaxID=3028117 RepID=UPI0016848B80|nr:MULTISPECIES: hypothetical protein [unclassified Coleofasciculus]MBD1903403.1 hypothetical protein [Coleofasciculus sp. FACHB-125]MBD2047240.1 hypothetical protein [Coleofasciculus sp. FACHB-64]
MHPREAARMRERDVRSRIRAATRTLTLEKRATFDTSQKSYWLYWHYTGDFLFLLLVTRVAVLPSQQFVGCVAGNY